MLNKGRYGTVYKWDSSFETGHEKIDNQHKQLIAVLNDLIEASTGGKGSAVIMETVDFLIGYTIQHFSDEEQLQVDYNYPDYLNHKQLHDDFKTVVTDFVKRINKEDPTEEIIEMVSSTVGDWLVNHIKGDDFRMAAFVKAATPL